MSKPLNELTRKKALAIAQGDLTRLSHLAMGLAKIEERWPEQDLSPYWKTVEECLPVFKSRISQLLRLPDEAFREEVSE